MDCHFFRKNHLAYLDDTLPGDLMAQAQRHVLACDPCAAHDTLVRRSLMVVRSMPVIEPSAAFQSRLQARLAECRAERQSVAAPSRRVSPARTVLAMAASAVIGTMAFDALRDEAAPTLAMQPVLATPPAPVSPAPYISPALVQAMSTGNPVWPAALIVEEAPVGFVNTEYRFAEMR
ncbi:anti-sigma factor family protein [Gemmatimonas sp.]